MRGGVIPPDRKSPRAVDRGGYQCAGFEIAAFEVARVPAKRLSRNRGVEHAKAPRRCVEHTRVTDLSTALSVKGRLIQHDVEERSAHGHLLALVTHELVCLTGEHREHPAVEFEVRVTDESRWTIRLEQRSPRLHRRCLVTSRTPGLACPRALCFHLGVEALAVNIDAPIACNLDC